MGFLQTKGCPPFLNETEEQPILKGKKAGEASAATSPGWKGIK